MFRLGIVLQIPLVTYKALRLQDPFCSIIIEN